MSIVYRDNSVGPLFSGHGQRAVTDRIADEALANRSSISRLPLVNGSSTARQRIFVFIASGLEHALHDKWFTERSAQRSVNKPLVNRSSTGRQPFVNRSSCSLICGHALRKVLQRQK